MNDGLVYPCEFPADDLNTTMSLRAELAREEYQNRCRVIWGATRRAKRIPLGFTLDRDGVKLGI
jgi:hypothetical protein